MSEVRSSWSPLLPTGVSSACLALGSAGGFTLDGFVSFAIVDRFTGLWTTK